MISIVGLIAGWLVARVVGRIALTIGVGWFTINGMETALQWIETKAMESTAQLPGEVIAYMGLMKADVALSIFFSAMSIKVSIMVLRKIAKI